MGKRRKKFKFSISLNATIQALGTAAIFAEQLAPGLPPHKREIVTSTAAVLMAASGLLAHFKNPDGTPAAQEYKPWELEAKRRNE